MPFVFEQMWVRATTEPFPWLAAFSSLRRGLELVACLTIVCALAAYPIEASSQGEPLAVRLFQAHKPVREVQILPPFEIVGGGTSTLMNTPMRLEGVEGRLYIRNNQIERRQGMSLIHLKECGRRSVRLLVPPLNQRRYHGEILIKAERDGALAIVNKVSLKDYINEVVASELPPGTPGEALKAQAILAQTLLLNRRRQNELGDSTEEQSYLGAAAERPEVNFAVRTVLGKHLYFQGIPAVVYYHSTCAGGTSQAAEYFELNPGSLPYLGHVACDNCQRSPFWQVTRKEIPSAVFEKVFGSGLPTIVKHDSAQRALSVRLSNGELLSGYQFWLRLGQSLGWDKAPGTRFSLKRGANNMIVIESTGAGHGVGLCQWGASELARRGKNCADLLSYYFPSCQVR
jgi:stage II sporulation protein D